MSLAFMLALRQYPRDYLAVHSTSAVAARIRVEWKSFASTGKGFY